MDPYERLANAIVIQAADDYRSAMKTLRYYPIDREALEKKKDCENFFMSEWFQVLSEADGPTILNRLRKEFE